MVKSSTIIMVVAMLVALICTGLPSLKAQSPMGAPMMFPGSPPTTHCMTALLSAIDCLNYVMTGSNVTVPNKACCPEVATLLQYNPLCLCILVGQAKDYNVDVQRALKVPGACKLPTPPVSLCPAILAPKGGAAMTPASRDSGNNGASSAAVHHLSTLICFVVAIFIAYYF